ncbi:MAG: tripartite tricarboxylate transporter substrate-binding protein [Pseudomonadota bacterium]
MNRILLFSALIGALGLAPAAAQAYPHKAVTVVVPYAAGGPTDKVARDLVDSLRKQLPRTTFLIEHTPGAGGTTGVSKVARAPNDGHTVLLAHIGMATAPWMYKNLKYQVQDDFEYLGLITEVPMTLVGRPGLPPSDVADLTRWIVANKGKVNLANAGNGSASHLCGLLLQQALKVRLTTVPFSGTGPAMAAMLGDQVDLMCDQTTNTTPQIESGTIKAYGVTSESRMTHSPTLAKLPTLKESGLRGMQITIWHGLYAPKGTPASVVDRLNQMIRAVLADPAFVKSQHAVGAVVVKDARMGGAEHKRFVEAETARWGRVIKASGQALTN